MYKQINIEKILLFLIFYLNCLLVLNNLVGNNGYNYNVVMFVGICVE